jgi:uncharacterized protein
MGVYSAPAPDQFEWDDAKATVNLEKHGVDFEDAIAIFEGLVVETPSHRGGEERWKAIGRLGDVLIAVVYTERDSRRRIISARRARRNERAEYRATFT